MSKNNLLAEHVILVTGAGGAIGGAAAQTYAAQGASVVLMGRSLGPLEKTYDTIVAAGHPQPAICPLDFATATATEIQSAVTTIEQEFGRLDGLLHAAATLGSLTPVEHYDAGLWSRVLQVNLTAPLLITRACLPMLKAATHATILFSTCAVGQQGRAYWGAFAAAQAAIENLAQTLADELEANTSVQVNCIDPGPIRSRLRALAYPGEDPNTLPSPGSVMAAYLDLMARQTTTSHSKRINVSEYLNENS